MNKRAPWHLGWGEVVFSLKTFLAAMLALGIAQTLGFSKPYWALATVYIVSQPLSGAVTSKALYRVGGTFVGSLMTLVLVPHLVNAPILFCVAMSAWVGLCLFLSLLDRTPRSYFFMLAGYTAAIIGFASVNEPQAVFDTAVARVQEITLGILCAALVSRLLFPRHVEPVLAERIESWLQDTGDWGQAVLAGRVQAENSRKAARKMAADTLGLVALAAYLPYDTASFQRTRQQLLILEQHMTALVPLLSAIGDRVAALRQTPGEISAPLRSLLGEMAAWIAAGQSGSEAAADDFRKQITDRQRALEHRPDWPSLLEFNLCARLANLVDVWEDCLVLRLAIARRSGRIPEHLDAAARFAGDPTLHLDARVAWVSGFAAVVGTLLCCAFWIGTGWNDGGTAAQLTAVFCCIFSSLDNPLPALKTHTWCLVGAIGIAAGYEFFLFPAIDGFPMLVLVLAPFLLAGGLFMATPVWGFPAFAFCVNSCLFLNLEPALNLDFQSFLNVNLAAVIASVMAMVVITLFRTIGAEAGVVKLLRAVWLDISELARQPDSPEAPAFVRRMVDRLGLLVPRLTALPPGSHLHATDMLKDIRVGLNIADIQRERASLSASENALASRLLMDLGAHFQEKRAQAQTPPGRNLLEAMDDAMARLVQDGCRSSAATTLLHSLVGMRRCLFPEAPHSNPGPRRVA